MDFQFELNFDEVFKGTDHIKSEVHISDDKSSTIVNEEQLEDEKIETKIPSIGLYDIIDEEEEDHLAVKPEDDVALKPVDDISLKPEENDDTSMGMQDSSLNNQSFNSNTIIEVDLQHQHTEKNNKFTIKKEPIEDDFIDQNEQPLFQNIKQEVQWKDEHDNYGTFFGAGTSGAGTSSGTSTMQFNRKSLKKLNIQQKQNISKKSKNYFIYLTPSGKLKKRKKKKFNVNIIVEILDFKTIEKIKSNPEKWQNLMRIKDEQKRKENNKLKSTKRKKKENKDKQKKHKNDKSPKTFPVKVEPGMAAEKIHVKVEPSIIKLEPEDEEEKSKPNYKKPRRVRCKYCNLSLSSQSYLKIHERVHTGEKPYKCDVCDKKFSSRGSLNSHKKSHSVERKFFECEICHLMLKNKLNYTEHLNIHSGVKPFKCETCGKRFTQSSVYRLHIKIHKGIKNFKCEYCDKSFRQKITLQNHVYAIHTHEKPFPCTLCEKKFHRSDALLMHMRMHQDIKLWQCKVCAFQFRTTSGLTRHMKTHTKEKLFKCDKCGFETARKDSLATHYRIHTGERPYKCEVCEMTFATFSTRKLHMRRHTGEKPHQCQVCKYCFTESSGLRRHLRRMHLNYFEKMEEKRNRKKEKLDKTIEKNLARIQKKKDEKESD